MLKPNAGVASYQIKKSRIPSENSLRENLTIVAITSITYNPTISYPRNPVQVFGLYASYEPRGAHAAWTQAHKITVLPPLAAPGSGRGQELLRSMSKQTLQEMLKLHASVADCADYIMKYSPGAAPSYFHGLLCRCVSPNRLQSGMCFNTLRYIEAPSK